MGKFIAGAFTLLALIVWEALSYWSVLDPTLAKLKESGPLGALIANTVTSPLAVLALAIAGLAFVIRGIGEMRKGLARDEQPQRSEPSFRTEIKPVITVNPTISPTISDQQSPDSKPESDEPPSLQYVQAEQVSTEFYDGIAAVFRNAPRQLGHRTPPARAVTAHLTYRNPHNPDEQELHINFGTWLGESTHFARFGPGQAQRLVIAVQYAGRPFALENLNQSDQSEIDADLGGGMYGPEQRLLSWLVGEVEVTLIDGDVTIYQGRFDYEIEIGARMSLRPI